MSIRSARFDDRHPRRRPARAHARDRRGAARLSHPCLAPDAESVAAQTASSFTRADYHSRRVLDELRRAADVVTYEFENVAIEPIEYLRHVPVHPAPAALEVAQDRAPRRASSTESGRPHRAVAQGRHLDELKAALAEIGAPAILKTLRLGYDGKGQVRITTPARPRRLGAIGERPAILEGFVTFSHEFSIILARGARRRDGQLSAALEPACRRHPRPLELPAPAEIARHWAEAAALAGRVADRSIMSAC
jgi:5-(carboxyamino)imidazole ribonucleotide synthase